MNMNMTTEATFFSRLNPEKAEEAKEHIAKSHRKRMKQKWKGRGNHDFVHIREIFLYVIFLIVFHIVSFASKDDEHTFFLTDSVDANAISQDFFHPGSRTPKAFEGIRDFVDFWTWLEDIFVPGIYPTHWYNDSDGSPTPLAGEVRQQMLYAQRRLGGAQLRQVRVKEGCNIPPQFSDDITKCYPKFSVGEESADFGPDGMWKWSETYEPSHWGVIGFYPSTGYVVQLGDDPQVAAERVAFLRENLWIDQQTRAVFVDVNFYNVNLNLFCFVRALVEFPASGGAVPTVNFKTMRILRYWGDGGDFRLTMDIFFFLFVIWYTAEEVKELIQTEVGHDAKDSDDESSDDDDKLGDESDIISDRTSNSGYSMSSEGEGRVRSSSTSSRASQKIRRKRSIKWYIKMWMKLKLYFDDSWNFLDWINIVFFITTITLHLSTLVEVNDLDFTPEDGSFVNVVSLSQKQNLIIICNAVNAFMLWFKSFKYLRFSPKLQQLTGTLSLAAKDIGVFLLMFLIVFVGYAMMGFLAFGAEIDGFRSVPMSMYTLFRTFIGDFNANDLLWANRFIGPLFFVVFLVFVILYLINMFLAIVNDAYTVYRQEKNRDDLFEVRIPKGMVQQYHNMKKWMRSKTNMDTVDLDDDEFVSLEEAEHFLNSNPRVKDIFYDANDLMQKFDRTGDGRLSKAEFKEARKYIDRYIDELVEKQFQSSDPGVQRLETDVSELKKTMFHLGRAIDELMDKMEDPKTNTTQRVSFLGKHQ